MSSTAMTVLTLDESEVKCVGFLIEFYLHQIIYTEQIWDELLMMRLWEVHLQVGSSDSAEIFSGMWADDTRSAAESNLLSTAEVIHLDSLNVKEAY